MDRAKAITKYVKISPQKARLAADLIRNSSVSEATSQLLFCNMKAGRLLKKTLDSAVANAASLYHASREELVVVEVRVDEGPTMKRITPKNRGGRNPILKRTSHFTIVVGRE